MSELINNSNNLIKYLEENEWEKESSILYHRCNGPEEYKISVLINPFIKKHFEIFIHTPHHSDRNYIYYEDHQDEESVISEIEKHVNKFQKLMSKWINEIQEEDEAREEFDDLLSEYGAEKNQEEGYYVISFANEKETYILPLPNKNQFDIISPKDKNYQDFTAVRYSFNQKDMAKFRNKLKSISQLIPYLNGWVLPQTKESYLTSYYSDSFEENKGRHINKAIHLRNIMFQILPTEYIYYIFNILFNDDDSTIDFIDIELQQDKVYLAKVKDEISDIIIEIAEKYSSFLTIDNNYRSMIICKVNVNIVEESDFKAFLTELKQKLEPVIK